MLWDSLLSYAEELMFLSKSELLLSGPVRGQSFANTQSFKKKSCVDLLVSNRLNA